MLHYDLWSNELWSVCHIDRTQTKGTYEKGTTCGQFLQRGHFISFLSFFSTQEYEGNKDWLIPI